MHPEAQEARDAYDKALEVQKDYDHKRAELLSVALSVLAGHAASPDGACTPKHALSVAERLILMVDGKVGDRPKLLAFPDRSY